MTDSKSCLDLTDDIHLYLKRLAEKAEFSNRVYELLVVALEKPLMDHHSSFDFVTRMPKNAPLWMHEGWDTKHIKHFTPSKALDIKVRHIRDWIEDAVMRKADWLREMDVKGYPLRLLHTDSLDDVLREADIDTPKIEHIAFQSNDIDDVSFQYELEHKDISVIHEFDDGFRVVKLLTGVAGAREAFFMNHAAGSEAYDDYFMNNEYDVRASVYSLRDQSNAPHITFEMFDDDLQLILCEGRENTWPGEQYVHKILSFLHEIGADLSDFANNSGYMFHDGQVCDVLKLPDGANIEGNLKITHRPEFRCPKKLNVSGIFAYDTMQKPFIRPCVRARIYRERFQISDNVMKVIDYKRNMETVRTEAWSIRHNGKHVYHKEDGPAITHFDLDTGVAVDKFWYSKGLLHREGGQPAVEFLSPDGEIQELYWYHEGQEVKSKIIKYRK